jgi:Pentapeptide repeats (8 copies)
LQGADLSRAQLQGANLDEADMEGVRLDEAALKLANVQHSHVWQATGTRCDDAQVTEPQLDVRREEPQSLGELVQSFGELVSLVRGREGRSRRSCEQLIAGQHQIRDVWRSCETKALTRGDYEKKHAEHLIELVCTATASQEQFAYGVYSNWVGESDIDPRMYFSRVRVSDDHRRAVAHGLFRASDRNGCPGPRAFSDRVKTRLQDLVR